MRAAMEAAHKLDVLQRPASVDAREVELFGRRVCSAVTLANAQERARALSEITEQAYSVGGPLRNVLFSGVRSMAVPGGGRAVFALHQPQLLLLQRARAAAVPCLFQPVTTTVEDIATDPLIAQVQ